MLSSGALVLVMYQTRHDILLVVGYATMAGTGNYKYDEAGVEAVVDGREVRLSQDGQTFLSLGTPHPITLRLKLGVNTQVLGRRGEEDLVREALEVKNLPPGDNVSALAWPLFCARALAFHAEAQSRWARAAQQPAAATA